MMQALRQCLANFGCRRPGVLIRPLQGQLEQMAPEIETLVRGKNDEVSQLVRKVVEIRDGVAAA